MNKVLSTTVFLSFVFFISTYAQNESVLYKGLDEHNSIGGAGYYKENATDDVLPLATCVYRSGQFHTVGEESKALFCPQLPRNYTVKEHQHSWTGKTVSYSSDNYSLDMEVRSTLPGPLFKTEGKSIFMRWMIRNEPNVIKGLQSGESWGPVGVPQTNDQVFLAASKVLPSLIIASQPLESIVITSNRHWEFKFKEPGGSIMYVPLLDKKDIPTTHAMMDYWIALAANPPIQCSEKYGFKDDQLLLLQEYVGSEVSPIPPIMSLYGEQRGLLKLPENRITLCHTLWGPYEIVEGSIVDIAIASDWIDMGFEPTRKIKGNLSPLPKELAYAGDYTWDPEHSAMDQLLALRTWAPLVEYLPKDQQKELLQRMKVPTHENLKKDLVLITEPVLNQQWAKDFNLFDHQGDVAFDIDWYNGLSLSGLERAVQCSDKRISDPAKKLAKDSKPERLYMMNFYQFFHEWFIGAAWNDSRGWLMDLDCGHNGIEGMLAEARLRDMEGDAEGADFARYLAVKTAVFHLSTMYLREYRLALENGFVVPGEPGYGIKKIHAWVDLGPGVTAANKKQYFLASSFPEFAALQKMYGPIDRLKDLTIDWEQHYPERYEDWELFYLGEDYEERYKTNPWAQEARVQAAAFYGIAPEIFLRLWTLDQSADDIEALYKTPLNLSQQMHLRLGTKLVKGKK